MAYRSARWMLLAAASLCLTGCTSIFHAVFSGRSKPAPVLVRAAPAPAADPLTASGRSYLAAGNTGLAIEAFQHAIGRGEPAAPALNGLAVAYARIDRFETAQRLFEQAIALEPQNEQYAANMARLLRSPALAMRHDGDIALAVAPPAPAPAPVAAPGQLVRISANEYRITTAQPSPAPRIGKSAQASRNAHAPRLASAERAPARPAVASLTVTNPFSTAPQTTPASVMIIGSRSAAAAPAPAPAPVAAPAAEEAKSDL